MKSVFAVRASVVALTLGSLAPACSSKSEETPDPPITECDPAKCAPGNSCVAMDGDLKCRKSCASNVDAAGGCPANYFCAATNIPSVIPAACTKVGVSESKALCRTFSASSGTRLTAFQCGSTPPTGCLKADEAGNYCCNEASGEALSQPVCMKMFGEVASTGPKQWGAHCDPRKGFDDNTDCDFAQGFFCHAENPTDAAAYCTRYDCIADRGCAGGFACMTINTAPNATTAKREFHQVRSACIRRDYCAPCRADVDCLPFEGRPQHCVLDDNSAGFCAPECGDSKNCNPEAKCVDMGIGVNVCYPRAGTCVGDGSLCSPCRNDSQCGEDGLCIRGDYTTERFCAKKSAGTCTETSNQCPASSKPDAEIHCSVPDPKKPNADVDNLCYGLYNLGAPQDGQQPKDIGCWTPARR